MDYTTKEQRLASYRAIQRTKAVTRLAILAVHALAGFLTGYAVTRLAILAGFTLAGFLAGYIAHGLIIMNALGI